MSATRAQHAAPITAAERHELTAAVLLAVGLEDTDPTDVLSVHLGTRSVGIRAKVRGPRGKLIQGRTTTTAHPILPEPLED
jgi:hypothetical protein